MGKGVGHSGIEVESLLKNIQQSYQQVKQHLHMSGCDTFTPTIRNSSDLFTAFDEFYCLFNPKGGSALPAVVMTESSSDFLNT